MEQPSDEAFATLNASLLRAAGLLGLALVVAVIASLALARRMIVPIDAVRAGAARIGAGGFDQRIAIRTALTHPLPTVAQGQCDPDSVVRA